MTGVTGVGVLAGAAVGAYRLDLAGHGLADVVTGQHHQTFANQDLERNFGPGTGDRVDLALVQFQAACCKSGLGSQPK